MTTYSATADDLYARSDGLFRDTYQTLKFGKTSAAYTQHAYIPFPVDDIPRGTQIESAIFRIVQAGGTNNPCKLKYGVADHGEKPSDYPELAAKTFVSGHGTEDDFADAVAGEVTELDVTASVQAKIDAGWYEYVPPGGPGDPPPQSSDEGIIAILLFDHGSATNADRTFASSGNTTYDPPTLEIILSEKFIPRIIFF